MDALRQELRTRYFALLADHSTVQEFEAWIYQTPQLEDVFAPHDYVSLLELDYSAESAVEEMTTLMNNTFDDPEWEAIKLKNRLTAALECTSHDPTYAIYELQEEGYHFLDELLEYDRDYYSYTVKSKSVERFVKWLENGEVIVHKGLDVHGKPFYRFEGLQVENVRVKNVRIEFCQNILSENLGGVRQLLESRPELVYVRDPTGDLPIHVAARYNTNTQILKYLLAEGSDIHARDGDGRTPLHLASGFNGIVSQYDSMEQSISQQMCGGPSDYKLFRANWHNWWFIRRQTVNFFRSVRKAITLRWQLLKIRFGGVNECHSEVDEQDNIPIIKLLLAWGADVNCKDRYGRTPLHQAIEDNPFYRDAQYLIERGADVNAQEGEERQTPLHIAACLCNFRKFQILLDAEASLDSLDRYGKTPCDVFGENRYRLSHYRRLDIDQIAELIRRRKK